MFMEAKKFTSFFSFLLKIPDKSIIISIHICKKVFSVNFYYYYFFFANLFSPTLSLKSNVYLAHHIVCFDCILALTAISGMWGRRETES